MEPHAQYDVLAQLAGSVRSAAYRHCQHHHVHRRDYYFHRTGDSDRLLQGIPGALAGIASDLLRWKASSALTLDNTYALTERMEPNGTALDRSLTDGGIETNHFSSLLVWRPSFSVLMRSFSGYDLRRIADEDPNVYRQRRVDPWTTELTIDPRRSTMNYFVRYQLGYWPTRDSLWEGDLNYKGIYRTILTTGLLYNGGAPGFLTWNNGVGLFLSPGWRVDLTAHALIPDTGYEAAQNASLTDVLFIVTRDLHCWQAQFVYKDSVNLSKTVSLLFNLKLGADAPKPIGDNDLESQFYPWRAKPDALQNRCKRLDVFLEIQL